MAGASPEKIVIYQVFTRLFGVKETSFVPWGSKEENGVGKFADFTDKALQEIKKLGVTHIWYTGILHHALIGDYKKYGISDDHPEVVKGRAGSPYAIKDYYNVNPDLALEPGNRLQEFEALIERSHRNGLKVIIDIVPNHVARKYESISKPENVIDFGEKDDPSATYSYSNDFYYIPNEAYISPDWHNGLLPLGGNYKKEDFGTFREFPAKWTGNGSRKSQPDINDWYETVKINYGISPDGKYDFPVIPESYASENHKKHFEFWESREIPETWIKWKDITAFWLRKGVDAFRYDMAEMVPVHFWSYLNSHIKSLNPEVLLIAEIYNPEQYESFINLGKMDYLYDKVDLYDKLRAIIENNADCHHIFPITERNHPISGHLLHFLENHDEQRIASTAFAGNPFKAFPAMVLSTCIDRGSTLVYFGQEVGEKAEENAGFGSPTRTSIFDYIGVPAHQKWMNGGKFDGALLTDNQRKLRESYAQLLNFSLNSSALEGVFYDLHRHNSGHSSDYPGEKIYGFARYDEFEKLFILSNFDEHNAYAFRFHIYFDLILTWQLKPGIYQLENLFNKKTFHLVVFPDMAYIEIKIEALESLILTLKSKL